MHRQNRHMSSRNSTAHTQLDLKVQIDLLTSSPYSVPAMEYPSLVHSFMQRSGVKLEEENAKPSRRRLFHDSLTQP